MNWPSERELGRLPLVMQYTNSQELARKFNGDEAVWRAFAAGMDRRAVRR